MQVDKHLQGLGAETELVTDQGFRGDKELCKLSTGHIMKILDRLYYFLS